MGLETVEAGEPHLSVGLEPRVQLGKGLQPESVEPALTVDADVDEASLAQDPQVLGHQRLADPEPLHECPYWQLPSAQGVEETPTLGLRDGAENVGHSMNMLYQLHVCQDILRVISAGTRARRWGAITGHYRLRRPAAGVLIGAGRALARQQQACRPNFQRTA